ncbi:MAG: dolichol-phosphate mannosyltransferase, partial [Actinomycetota bacterium]
PEALPGLYRAVTAGADLALGSRYVSGGGAASWPLSRRLLSRGANLFARLLLRPGARDVTTGFRIYSRRAAQLLLDGSCFCNGFGFQVEGVWTLARAGLQIKEVPITFHQRAHGTSKMSATNLMEAARRCLRLSLTGPSRANLPERSFVEES